MAARKNPARATESGIPSPPALHRNSSVEDDVHSEKDSDDCILEIDTQSRIIKAGWLTKKGDIFHSWKQRWFVLRDDGTLSYYQKEEGAITRSAKGVIDLCGDDIHLEAGAHEVHSHYFTITTPTRLYEISAPTEAVRANWIAVLSKLINGIGAAASEKPPGEKRLVNGRDVGAMLGAEDLLKCPLSKEWLRDPVICSDGFTYEREAALTWFEAHNSSPVTGEVLKSFFMKRNEVVAALIGADWRGALQPASAEQSEVEVPIAASDMLALMDYKERDEAKRSPQTPRRGARQGGEESSQKRKTTVNENKKEKDSGGAFPGIRLRQEADNDTKEKEREKTKKRSLQNITHRKLATLGRKDGKKRQEELAAEAKNGSGEEE